MEQSNPKRGGLIYSEHPSETSRYMQGHGLATLFLAGVCRDETDDARRKKLTEVLTRAVKYIVKAQSSAGGWYDTSKVEGHDFATISATVIQIQALQAAENAGIPVPDGRDRGRQGIFEEGDREVRCGRAQRGEERRAIGRYRGGARLPLFEPLTRRTSCRTKWQEYCQAEIPDGRGIKFGRDELIHYYYAQAVFNLGGKPGATTARPCSMI